MLLRNSAARRTSGTCSFSAWEEAASVVTQRFAIEALNCPCLLPNCLRGRARGALTALEIMTAAGEEDGLMWEIIK